MRSLIFILSFFSAVAFGSSFNDSVLIGGSGPPDSKSQLEIRSTTKGTLFSRMTTTQRDAISGPTTSLIIFNTTTNVFEFWDGSSWSAVGSLQGPASSTNNGIAVWNGTTGKLLKDSSVTISGTTVTGTLSGNASTATALAADPADCASNRFANAINASGTLTCAQVDLTTSAVTGALTVANGGTGRSTLTNHGVLIGATTSAITQSSVGATGTVLIGNTGADPTFSSGPIGLTSLGVNDSGATSATYLKTSAIGTPTLTLKAINSQTANLMEVLDSSGSPQMIFTSGGNFEFFHNVASPTTRMDLRGSVSQSSANAGNNARYGMFVAEPSSLATNAGSGIALGGPQTSSVDLTPYGYIWVNKNNASSGDVGGSLHFATRNNSTGNAQRALELDSSGNADFFSTLNLNGSSSGKVTTQVSAAAGTYNWNYPTSAGSSGQPLLSGGGSSTAMTFGTLGVAAGGTGQTSYTDGQVLIGNTTGNTLAKSTLTAGSNITITNGSGSITIAASSSAAAAWTYASQTTGYTAAINNYDLLSGASFTVTLPTAASQSGKSIILQHNGTSLSQIYTINTTSSQTINGPAGAIASGSYVLYTNGEVIWLMSDGSNWQIVAHQTESGPTAYTPTFSAGWGTVTSKNFYWSRHGRLMKIFGYATCGTVTNAIGSVTIPTSAAIDTTVHGSNTTAAAGSRVGYMNNGQTASFCPMVTAGGTSTTLIYLGGLVSQNIPLIPTATTANNMGSNSTIFALDAELAITGWQP